MLSSTESLLSRYIKYYSYKYDMRVLLTTSTLSRLTETTDHYRILFRLDASMHNADDGVIAAHTILIDTRFPVLSTIRISIKTKDKIEGAFYDHTCVCGMIQP